MPQGDCWVYGGGFQPFPQPAGELQGPPAWKASKTSPVPQGVLQSWGARLPTSGSVFRSPQSKSMYPFSYIFILNMEKPGPSRRSVCAVGARVSLPRSLSGCDSPQGRVPLLPAHPLRGATASPRLPSYACSGTTGLDFILPPSTRLRSRPNRARRRNRQQPPSNPPQPPRERSYRLLPAR